MAGCSEEAARQTLTSPSLISESGPVGALSDDRSGSVRSANPAETRAWASSHGWAMDAAGLVVEGTDTITAVSGACPTKSITVRGVPVALTSTTTFTAPITCASLATDMTVKVTALLTYTASGFTVTATNVGPAGGDSDGDDDDDSETGTGGGKKARGEGVIGAITGNCPTLTLIITGTRVSTTASTTYENGSCETLRQGTKVTIDGELKPGGTAVAEKIIIRSVPGHRVSGDGRVDSVDDSTSCPALTFTVRGVSIVTSSATTFTGGECADIRRGSHVDVTGDYDGSELTATAVHVRKP
jgi:hypothetical protein